MNGLSCRSERRRLKVRQLNAVYGLDYLEIEPAGQLKVYLLGKVPGLQLDASNVRIEGGRQDCAIPVKKVELRPCGSSTVDDYLLVTVDRPGDYSSVYTLRVVQRNKKNVQKEAERKGCGNSKCPQPMTILKPFSVEQDQQKDEIIPHPSFDPKYNSIEFRFFSEDATASEFDCRQEASWPPPEPLQEPNINYLAKDYASFRQLILDRMSLTMPEWNERHVPDIGVALAEILAYAGDHLSYYQDAVATEAYLDTARQRISVRRHARLVDYRMHEGCNARVWISVQVSQDIAFAAKEFYFITSINGLSPEVSENDLSQIPASKYEAFEPLTDNPEQKIEFWQSHNEIHFYTWDHQECWLPKGATCTTLQDAFVNNNDAAQQQAQVQQASAPRERERCLHLNVGDVLIFEELCGSRTVAEADANPRHRHPVRLTEVKAGTDRLNNDAPVLEVRWAEEDALPFPLCLSAIGSPPCCELIENMSVARGNVVLAGHGRRVTSKDIGAVPIREEVKRCEGENDPADKKLLAGRYESILPLPTLTYSQPLPKNAASASELFAQNARQALPQITLFSSYQISKEQNQSIQIAATNNCVEQQQVVQAVFVQSCAENSEKEKEDSANQWFVQPDLLASNANDHHFVVEVDNDGRAHLRFGDDELGEQPDAGLHFSAEYRVGNGELGNVGAESIAHIVLCDSVGGVISEVRNPLPAQGGTEPETLDEVRLAAPQAFRKERQRAVIADDYAEIIERDFKSKVQRAKARLRWNGSWHEVLLAVDPYGKETAEAELLEAIKKHLHKFRRIGHDVAVMSARRVPIEIKMTVNVLPTYLRGHVKAELLYLFSSRVLPDGRRGLFHPDNLTFGDGIRVSKLIAEAQKVTGVESAQVTTLQRIDMAASNDAIVDGILPVDSFAIASVEKIEFITVGGR